MLSSLNKLITPNLARVLGAIALLVAVCWFGFIAYIAVQRQTPGLHQFDEPVAELSTVGGEHRLVRIARRDKNRIICSEGPRQLQYVSSASDRHDGPASRAVLSTVYLREAGWQICNAYANGVIDETKYAELLTALVTGR